MAQLRDFVRVLPSERDKPRYRKDLLPVEFVMGDAAGRIDSPLYSMFGMRGEISRIEGPGKAPIDEYFISTPNDPYRAGALKWDGEWQITYETFRDMGTAYAVGLVLIYLLVVAQFGSYLTPLVIMAPIPLTIIGILPGHALFGAQFTATSMIGMIALAGIIVRNSILLVDFIHLRIAEGAPFARRGGGVGRGACPADRADRGGGDARRALHPRRPDLQRTCDLAAVRHRGVDAAHPGGDPLALLRRVPAQVRRHRLKPASLDLHILASNHSERKS